MVKALRKNGQFSPHKIYMGTLRISKQLNFLILYAYEEIVSRASPVNLNRKKAWDAVHGSEGEAPAGS